MGPPAAGKTTFAQSWVQRNPELVHISTDQVRLDLFGTINIQGHWEQIEYFILQQVETAITQSRPIIYDATNSKRAWRLDLLQKLNRFNVQWMGWRMTTSTSQCIQRNQHRAATGGRNLPRAIIEQAADALNHKQFGPHPAEGFIDIQDVPILKNTQTIDFDRIEKLITELPRRIQNRQNRNATTQADAHPYSTLIAFERLIYLIVLLIQVPGIGTLHKDEPDYLKTLLEDKNLPEIKNSTVEIALLLKHRHGNIYSDLDTITQDLRWLEKNHIANNHYVDAPFELASQSLPDDLCIHRYSERDQFLRLMQLIRFIAHHPFVDYASEYPKERAAIRLRKAMETAGIYLGSTAHHTLRRDIQEALNPYGIFKDSASMKKGYFIGCGILSEQDLRQVFQALDSHVTNLDDPLLVATHQRMGKRLKLMGTDMNDVYPVKAILQEPFIDAETLLPQSLGRPEKVAELAKAIENSQMLELMRLRGRGSYPSDIDDQTKVLPLQIVFQNRAWYLGYVVMNSGKDYELLKFERLDRIGAYTLEGRCDQRLQQVWLKRLHKLLQASYSLFIGRNVEEQRAFFGKKVDRDGYEQKLELWFSSSMYDFVSAGTRRFTGIQLSPPNYAGADTKQYKLKGTKNKQFPHRLQAMIPCWVAEDDFDLVAWVLRFGGNVKVVAPDCLAQRVYQQAIDAAKIYKSD